VQKAKLLFEEEKANILDQIPKEIINDFRTCGFAKWNKEYLPCMQLGPYDVAPGLIRDQWMDMFENVSCVNGQYLFANILNHPIYIYIYIYIYTFKACFSYNNIYIPFIGDTK
jgi:hypothetical protein